MKTEVLIVEDDYIIADEIAMSLTNLNYSVLGIVHNGKDALVKISEVIPDIILMDIKLSNDTNGIDTVEEIKITDMIFR